MTERASHILKLKGVETEDDSVNEASEPDVQPNRVLEMYRRRKFDALNLELELMQLEKKALQLIIDYYQKKKL